MSKFIFHAGARTRAFDALGGVVDKPLITVAYLEGHTLGHVECVEPGQPQRELDPVGSQGSPTRGHRAFTASPGGIYRVETVEMVPQVVTRYVAYDAASGFREVPADAYHDASRQGAGSQWADSLPRIEGASDSQLAFALAVRGRAIQAVIDAPELQPALRRRKFASWFCARAKFTPEQWREELRALIEPDSTTRS